ncbi:hypothetical protein AAE478_010622 [Parahypoxylon ruwenzoriense]
MDGQSCKKDSKKPVEDGPSTTIDDHAALLRRQTALVSLANLPFKTVISVFRHQWHKDKTRMTFAHAQQFMYEYNLPGARIEWPNLAKYRPRHYRVHAFQLQLLKEDLVWHREKFTRLYLDSLVTSTRSSKKDPITPSEAHKIRKTLVSELRISLPKDLSIVYFGKVPTCMDAAIDAIELTDLVDRFGAERYPMILNVPMSVHLWSVHQDFPDLLPKSPAPWDWSMPADVIEANHWKSKEDLL